MERDAAIRALDETEDILRDSKAIDESSSLEQVREEIVFLSGPVKRNLQAAIAKLKESNDTENGKRADSLLSDIFEESARLVTLGAQLMLSPREDSEQKTPRPQSQSKHSHHHHHHHRGSGPREQVLGVLSEEKAGPTRNRSYSSGKSTAVRPSLATITTSTSKDTSTLPKVRSGMSPRYSSGRKVGSPLASAMPESDSPAASTRGGGPPDIPSSQIECCEEIGRGSYGTVYRGKVGGKWAAVKVPKQQSLSDEQMRAFLSEILIMKRITCQHVVQFFGACTEPGKLMIVSELMACDLDDVIHKKSKFVRLALAKKLCLAQDMAAGVNWLHTICNIVHRDLKPANFLLDASMHVKVTDFGFSRVLKEGHEKLIDTSVTKGSLLYMAPEVMRHEEYGRPADVYAYGLILYELLTEEEPFCTFEGPKEFIHAIKEEGHRLEVPDDLTTPAGEQIPKSLCDLMRACTDQDQKLRPTMGDVLTCLDAATVEVITGDSHSSIYDFWVKNFVGPFQEEVSWEKVEAALSRQISVSPISLAKIKRLVVQKKTSDGSSGSGGMVQTGSSPLHVDFGASGSGSGSPLLRTSETVSLTMLSNAFKWIGDFFDASIAQSVLSELGKIVGAQWFHGDISQKEAEMRLNQRPEGSFLIRASKTSPRDYPFTLSKLKGGMPTHKRIGRLSYSYDSAERYVVCTDYGYFKCQTIIQVVDHLKEIGEITSPCPKNIYVNAYA